MMELKYLTTYKLFLQESCIVHVTPVWYRQNIVLKVASSAGAFSSNINTSKKLFIIDNIKCLNLFIQNVYNMLGYFLALHMNGLDMSLMLLEYPTSKTTPGN